MKHLPWGQGLVVVVGMLDKKRSTISLAVFLSSFLLFCLKVTLLFGYSFVTVFC